MRLHDNTRARWALTLAIGILLVWLAPPFPWQARRTATRLATGAGCPRTVPSVTSHSVRGLTETQRCGVLWAALGALPPASAEYVQTHVDDLSAVSVLGFSEHVAVPGRMTKSNWVPHESFAERQRMKSVWSMSLTILPGPPGVHMIEVDKRTGVARRLVLAR